MEEAGAPLNTYGKGGRGGKGGGRGKGPGMSPPRPTGPRAPPGGPRPQYFSPPGRRHPPRWPKGKGKGFRAWWPPLSAVYTAPVHLPDAATWPPASSAEALASACVTRTCDGAFADTRQRDACICQGLQSACADRPGSPLCEAAFPGGGAQWCPQGVPGLWPGALWEAARRTAGTDSCGLYL